MAGPAAQRVLIVGGGVAGSSLALRLQSFGISAHIVERNDVWGALGTGITLMGPALRALQQLGVLDEVMENGSGAASMQIFDAAGNLLLDLDIPPLLGPEYPSVGGILRPTLHKIISQAALGKGATVQTGMSVTALEETPEGVRVTFTDGTVDTYDLVVGADGLNSTVRALILGDENPQPRFLGQSVWRALLDRPEEVKGEYQFYGPGVKTGFTPLSDTQMYMFLVERDSTLEPPAYEDRPAIMRQLLEPFGGVVAKVREKIVSPEQVDVRPLTPLLLDGPWYRGRVLLIGDAAHATTPQLAMGGGIALEDAIVLSEILANESDLPTALEAFMDRRYERCAMVVNNSVQLSEWEKNADEHEHDAAMLQNASFAALAAPI